ncbi:MAG: PDZ domain-containing protein, partial [Clostridia bacterium]|nr:PDZ domain-containing protein [Clostridia bacterium]
MKRKFSFIYIVCFLLCFLTLFGNTITVKADADKVYLGGMPAGFSLETKGARIVGVCDVITSEGVKSPAKCADIRNGDVIIKIDGVDVNDAKEVGLSIKSNKEHLIQIERQGETLIKSIIPAKDLNGEYRLGVFIRDDICGIGTVTFIKNNRIASLGHPVIGDDGELVKITGGAI